MIRILVILAGLPVLAACSLPLAAFQQSQASANYEAQQEEYAENLKKEEQKRRAEAAQRQALADKQAADQRERQAEYERQHPEIQAAREAQAQQAAQQEHQRQQEIAVAEAAAQAKANADAEARARAQEWDEAHPKEVERREAKLRRAALSILICDAKVHEDEYRTKIGEMKRDAQVSGSGMVNKVDIYNLGQEESAWRWVQGSYRDLLRNDGTKALSCSSKELDGDAVQQEAQAVRINQEDYPNYHPLDD